MAAVNLAVWHHNIGGATEPYLIKGLVQAASTQAIKQGELCTWNNTTGYWTPADAAADTLYNLAFAAEEINTINTPAARYSTFIVPRPEDVFEIELLAAASIALEANYEPTGTDSQTATLDADGEAVFCSVGDSNYPNAEKYGGTSITSVSHGLFTMNAAFSYYKNLVRNGQTHMKVIVVTAAKTLLKEWSGALIINTGATAAALIELPQDAPIGCNFRFTATAAQALQIHSTGGGIIVKGEKQADSKYVAIDDEGDFIHVVCLGAMDWLAYTSITGTETAIAVET